jgi:hypothetical protein
MPPNNQYPQSPTPPSGNFDSSQYDFIMNPGTPQKKSLLPGGPKAKMAVLFGGIGLVVVLLLIIILSVLSGGSSATDNLVTVARKQNEVIRVADVGTKEATDETTMKLATMTQLVVTTDQKAMIDYLGKEGTKVDAKTLAIGTDTTIAKKLEAAESNGRFDETFTEIILTLLKDYQKSLRTGYEGLGKNGKQIIDQSYENVSLILEDNTLEQQ